MRRDITNKKFVDFFNIGDNVDFIEIYKKYIEICENELKFIKSC